MNPDLPKTPREEMETWLTSLLLGELSAGEAAAVRELIKHDPEFAKLHDELKSTIQLVQEAKISATEPTTAAQEQPKLSAERREKLLAQFKTVTPKEFVPQKRRSGIRLLELAAVFAILAILAAMMLPALSKAKHKAQSVTVLNNLRQLDGAKQQWALENNKTANDTPTFEDIKPYLGRGEMPSIAGESYVLGSVGEPPAAEMAKSDAKKSFRRWTANLPAGEPDDRVRLYADGKAYSVDGSTLGTKEVLANKPAESQFETITSGRVASPTRAFAGQPGQNLAYYDSSAGAQNYSGFNPVAAPVPSTPIILPAQSPADSLGQAGNYAFTPATSPSVSYGIVQDAAQPVTGGGASLPTRSLRSEGRVEQAIAANPPAPTIAPDSGSAEPARLIDPATGLPVAATATPGFGAPEVNTGTLGTAYRSRYGSPPTSANGSISASTGLPGAAEPAAASASLETRTYNVDPKTLRQGLETLGALPTSGLGHTQARTDSITPGLLYTGGASGGGGSLRGTTTTNSADDFSKGTRDFYARAGVNLKADEGKSVLYDDRTGKLLVRATPEELDVVDQINGALAQPPPQVNVKAKFTELTTNGNRALGFDWHGGKSPVVGSELMLGRTFTANSTDANGLWSDNSQHGKQASFGLVTNGSSLDIVGYTDISARAGLTPGLPAKSLRSTTPQLLAESESLERSNERGRLEQLTDLTKSESTRKLSELSDDSGLRETTLGLKVVEEKLASLQKDAVVSATDLAQAADSVKEARFGLNSQRQESANRDALLKVPRAWEAPTKAAAKAETDSPKDSIAVGKALEGRQANKLDSLHVEGAPYDGLPLGEVVRHLSELSQKADPEKRGINLIVNPNNPNTQNQPQFVDPATGLPVAPPAGPIDVSGISVKLNKPLANARLRDVLDEVVRSAERPIKYSIEPYGVVFSLADVQDQPVVRKPSTNAPIPQPEIQTSENNFSTFSLNVSDVSFKLAAASLEKGQMPDPTSVRSEEFINAFDYRDPEPAAGAPIAFAWERARYSFAHNRDLLRFSLKTAAAGRVNGRPLNIVLLLDNSGSMERADRVRIIREALRVLAGQLQPQDKLSVITFARTPRLVADGISGDRAGEVTEAVSGLTPEGGTNLEEAMNLGYQTAARHYRIGGINRVVLLTDGAANLGDVEPTSLKEKVEAARKQGIALDCFGIGWEGFNDDLLEVLSRNGDGRYGFLNSPDKAAKDFVGQLAGALKVAASDVKVQVEFNPHRVTSYRQIGYAKHQLTKEQFRDNTVDAAEIAAQEAGNALYTVEVNPAGAGPLCTVRVRYKIPGTTNYREQAWDVPYTGNALSLEQSSPAMRLAGSASAFSEWLVASPFAGEVSPDAVLNVLRGVPEVFGADSRPKTLEWMIRQAKSIEGK